jgi:Leucine-rich repeat (LRR) protein
LPRGFYKLKYLETLLLQQNQLTNLTQFFAQGYYLKRIDVSHNLLQELNGLNQLKNLQFANFSSNKISEIPGEINQLKKLVILDLSNNQLLYLPKGLIGLIKLEELNLENNQLGSMPPNLQRLRKLKVLNLAGNPLGEKEKERIRKQLPEVEIVF